MTIQGPGQTLVFFPLKAISKPRDVRHLAVAGDASMHGVKSRVWPLDIGQDGAAPGVSAPVVNGVLGFHVGLLRNRPANLQLAATGKGEPASPAVGLLLFDLVVANGVRTVRAGIVIPGDLAIGGRGGQVAVVSNHASIDVVLAVTEQKGSRDIGDAKGEGEDSRGQDEAVDRSTDILGARGVLVQISQNVAAHHDHGHAEPGEAMKVGQDRPVTSKVGPEEVDFGDDEDNGNAAGEEVRGGIEEEELVADARHDNHDPGNDSDGEEGDDVAGADDIKDEVAKATDG